MQRATILNFKLPRRHQTMCRTFMHEQSMRCAAILIIYYRVTRSDSIESNEKRKKKEKKQTKLSSKSQGKAIRQDDSNCLCILSVFGVNI